MLELEHSICLHMKSQPESQTIRSWFKAVKRKAPSGVMTTVGVDEKQFSMVKRKAHNGIQYCIPLTRALIDEEVMEIIQEFVALTDSDFDFEVFSSSEPLDYSIKPEIEIAMDPLITLCTQWSKHKHDTWMKEKLDGGWQYGAELSFGSKTHPLLRQWTDLPEKYREIDDKQPTELIRMLNDQGYVLLARDELERVLSKLD